MDELKQILYSQLKTILDRLCDLYAELLTVITEEKQILILADINLIDANNAAKERLLQLLDHIEEERVVCVGKIQEAFEGRIAEPRLLLIAEQYNPEQKNALKKSHAQLTSITARIAELNQENATLVHAALRNLNGALNSVKSKLTQKPTYQRQGALASSNVSAGRLVSKEA